jgi:hypothetical protein
VEEKRGVKRCQLRHLWLDHPEGSRQKNGKGGWMLQILGEEMVASGIRSVPLEDQQVMYEFICFGVFSSQI